MIVSGEPYTNRIYRHKTPKALPKKVANAKVIDGVLTVNDPEKRTPSLGVPAFLEWTPPEIMVVAVKTLKKRLARLGLSSRLAAWDLTAGSGTVADVVRLFGGATVSTDLCPGPEVVWLLDMMSVGTMILHNGIFEDGKKWGPERKFDAWDKVVKNPTLVFLDPSSRGLPAMSYLTHDGDKADRDVALFDRGSYIETIASAASRAARRLAPEGS